MKDRKIESHPIPNKKTKDTMYAPPLIFFTFVAAVTTWCSAITTTIAVPLPHIPSQFSADLIITSHQLDPKQNYPPRERHIKIVYDNIGGMAYAKIIKGYEAGRTYIRRYDLKNEYMVRGGKYPECRRSYLGEKMPEVLFPRQIQYKGKDNNNNNADHWIYENVDSLVHIYSKDLLPFQATEESIANGKKMPLSTYEFRNMVVGPPKDKNIFEIPSGYTHETCENYVGGYPYLHAFLHFLRF